MAVRVGTADWMGAVREAVTRAAETEVRQVEAGKKATEDQVAVAAVASVAAKAERVG